MAVAVVGRLLRVAFGAVLVAGVLVMVTRVDSPARFVTWWVVGFTAVAAASAAVGAANGRRRPAPVLGGLLASLPVAYVLPIAPMAAVALVLLLLAGVARARGGFAAGLATGVGTAMLLLTVAQGPAVECGVSSLSSNSGPWWVRSTGSSGGSGVSSPDGRATGTLYVGDREYAYTCVDGALTRFEATR